MNKTLKTVLIIIAVFFSIAVVSGMNSEPTQTSNDIEDMAGAKESFDKGCKIQPELKTYCDCAWNYLLDNTTADQFDKLIMDYANEPVSAEHTGMMQKAADACSDKI